MLYFLLLSLTYHSIIIDGANDFNSDEIFVQDRNNDSYWGKDNELDTLYLTWDRNNLYIGCVYSLNNNAILIFLDTGEGGIDNANLLDWYPRDVRFSGAKPDYLIALWNGNLSLGGVRKLSKPTIPLSYQGENKAISNGKYFLEVSIPFSSIGKPKILRITSLICGGDYSTSCDAMPDDKSIRGEGSVIINTFREINIDSDDDNEPDSSVSVNNAAKDVSYEVIFPSFNLVKLEPEVCRGNDVEITISLTEKSSVNVSLFNENGRFLKNLFYIQDVKDTTFYWDVKGIDEGVYIIKFTTSDNSSIIKKAFVRIK
uniref:T9SS type A sorting domain-containing protein n=1 Tax=candidate division WOR-3 bacterium TaxID=2052148 RepID=A0A7C4U789_UNCW3